MKWVVLTIIGSIVGGYAMGYLLLSRLKDVGI